MPQWGKLTERDQNAAIMDRLDGVDWDIIFERYEISNPITARRTMDKRIKVISERLGMESAPPGYKREGDGRIAQAFELWLEYQEAITELRNERSATEIDLHIDDDKPIGLALPADWHIGDVGTDHEALREHVEVLAGTDGMYSIVGGDAVNNMIHPRITDQHGADMPVDVQYMMLKWLLETLHPLAVRHGNHSEWTAQFAGVDMLAEIAAQQKVIATASGVDVRLHVGDQVYRLFIQHKYRYSSSFNLTHTVKRLWEMGGVDFDIGVVEHHHVPAMEPFVKHGRERLAIRPGTYKTRDGWAQRNGFYGARIGVPIVYLWPDRFRMEMHAPIGEVEGACEYLEWLRR